MDEKSFDETAREFALALDQARRQLGSALEDTRRQLERDREQLEQRLADARTEFRNVVEHGRAVLEAARAQFEKDFAAHRAAKGDAPVRSRPWRDAEIGPKERRAQMPAGKRKPPKRRRGGPQAGEPAPVEPKPRPTTLTGGAEAPIE